MPIQKVEKTFKFGILSTSYRVAIQERLVQKFKDERQQKLDDALFKESSYRVRSAFVRSFNHERSEISKLHLKKKAYSLIERIKRLCGISSNGEGRYIDTALAWRECIQLAQCEDRDIINGILKYLILDAFKRFVPNIAALDVLWVSLEQTPFADSLVWVCFDVAEIIMYWISNRTSRLQAISSTELKMLHIGRLIFLRLYFYHMTCKIETIAHSEFQLRLAYQINGFEDLVSIYLNYPDAWLCARIIDHVGKMITEGVLMSYADAELTDLDEVSSTEVKMDTNREKSAATSAEALPVTKDITEGVHSLSPTLWHALDVFRSTESKNYSKTEDLQHSLQGLVECEIMTTAENWLDCACAIYLLGDAAYRDLEVLKTVEKLFVSTQETRKLWHKWNGSRCGSSSNDVRYSRSQTLFQSLPSELIVCYVSMLTDVCLRSHDINIQRYALLGERYNPNPLEKTKSCETASLADLLVIKMPNSEDEWRIRYMTALGLLLIRNCFSTDPLRSGVSTAADALLKSAPVAGATVYCRGQSAPVQQDAGLDWLSAAMVANPWYQKAILPGVISNKFISLANRMGKSLGTHYLPSPQLPGVQEPKTQFEVDSKTKQKSKAAVISVKPKQSSQAQPNRTTVGDECLLRDGFEVKAASYNDRTSNDLKNVVEDQWVKDIHASLDAELAKK